MSIKNQVLYHATVLAVLTALDLERGKIRWVINIIVLSVFVATSFMLKTTPRLRDYLMQGVVFGLGTLSVFVSRLWGIRSDITNMVAIVVMLVSLDMVARVKNDG